MREQEKAKRVLMIPMETWCNHVIGTVKRNAERLNINIDYIRSQIQCHISESRPEEKDQSAVEQWNNVCELLAEAADHADKAWRKLELIDARSLIRYSRNLTWEDKKP